MFLLGMTVIYFMVLHVFKLESTLFEMLPIGVFVYLKVVLSHTKTLLFNRERFRRIVARNGRWTSVCELLAIYVLLLMPAVKQPQPALFYLIGLIVALLIHRFLVCGISSLIQERWQQVKSER